MRFNPLLLLIKDCWIYLQHRRSSYHYNRWLRLVYTQHPHSYPGRTFQSRAGNALFQPFIAACLTESARSAFAEQVSARLQKIVHHVGEAYQYEVVHTVGTVIFGQLSFQPDHTTLLFLPVQQYFRFEHICSAHWLFVCCCHRSDLLLLPSYELLTMHLFISTLYHSLIIWPVDGLWSEALGMMAASLVEPRIG